MLFLNKLAWHFNKLIGPTNSFSHYSISKEPFWNEHWHINHYDFVVKPNFQFFVLSVTRNHLTIKSNTIGEHDENINYLQAHLWRTEVSFYSLCSKLSRRYFQYFSIILCLIIYQAIINTYKASPVILQVFKRIPHQNRSAIHLPLSYIKISNCPAIVKEHPLEGTGLPLIPEQAKPDQKIHKDTVILFNRQSRLATYRSLFQRENTLLL